MNLKTYKTTCDKTILDWWHAQNPPKSLNKVWKGLENLLLGGKRIRAYLFYVGKGDFDTKTITPQEIALELLQSFALVHDDLIDNAKTRRGSPSVHIFLEENGVFAPKEQALLLGDWLLAKSFALFTQNLPENTQCSSLLAIYNTMLEEMVFGQSLDVYLTGENTATHAQITQKTLLKTAHYTITRPLQLGMAYTGQKNTQWVQNFGKNLGLAFQIQDDFLDFTSTAEILGKPPFNDVKECQQTLIRLKINQKGSKTLQNLFQKALGNDVTEASRQQIISQAQKESILEEITAEVNKHFTQAEEVLQAQTKNINTQQNQALSGIIQLLKARKA